MALALNNLQGLKCNKQRNQTKPNQTFVGKFLGFENSWILLRRINYLPNKRQEENKDKVEYNIDWN